MIDELIKELRSYPEHYTAAHRAADALEKREYYNCRLEDDLVKLEAAAESLREHIAEQQLDIVTLAQGVGRLREVLRPFAKAADALDIEGWGEGSIEGSLAEITADHCRKARAALGEEKK
jgi:hypothetical protein